MFSFCKDKYDKLDLIVEIVENVDKHTPALIPTRTRDMMIISKDLAARLVSASSALAMRKTLFSNRHFFLASREKKVKKKKNNDLI